VRFIALWKIPYFKKDPFGIWAPIKNSSYIKNEKATK